MQSHGHSSSSARLADHRRYHRKPLLKKGVARCSAGVLMIGTVIFFICLKPPYAILFRVVTGILLGTFGLIVYFNGCNLICIARGIGRTMTWGILTFCALGVVVSILGVVWFVYLPVLAVAFLLIGFFLPLVMAWTKPPKIDLRGRRYN